MIMASLIMEFLGMQNKRRKRRRMIKKEDIPEGSLLDQTISIKQVCDISNCTVSHHGDVSDSFISFKPNQL